MSTFRFRLQSLLNYREHQRDLCRQTLAQALAEDARLIAQRDQLMVQREQTVDELRLCLAANRLDKEQVAIRRIYTAQLQQQMSRVDAERQVVAARIDECRQHLVHADQEVKALEKLSDRQWADFTAQTERLEERARAEAWRPRDEADDSMTSSLR